MSNLQTQTFSQHCIYLSVSFRICWTDANDEDFAISGKFTCNLKIDHNVKYVFQKCRETTCCNRPEHPIGKIFYFDPVIFDFFKNSVG